MSNRLFTAETPEYYKKKVPNTWDYQVEFEKALIFLKKYLNTVKKLIDARRVSDLKCNVILKKHYTRTAIMLVNLLNGLRLSEGVEAFYNCCIKKEYEVGEDWIMTYVKVRKKKQKVEYRNVIIPDFIDLELCKGDVLFLWNNGNVKKSTFSEWVRSVFGHNTHSLRYAFISHLAIKGVDVGTICKFVRHSTIEHTYNYITRIKAEKTIFEHIYNDISKML